MPKINEIKNKNSTKSFKKRKYRPWDIEGNKDATLADSKDNLMQEIREDIKKAEEIMTKISKKNSAALEEVIELECDKVINWEFHDRPESELGDIEGLAAEFREIGQQQPCIVRKLPSNYQYELIVGERRWHAAKLAGIKLKVIIKDLTDNQAAIIQASENLSRKDLSDYARGMSYNKLIENSILTQKDLAEKLGISKQQISRLLSFSKIPEEITAHLHDMSKISSRTAEQIKQLSSKGEDYVKAIITLSDKLMRGDIGQEKLQILVEKAVQGKSRNNATENKVYSTKRVHLYTIKCENADNYSIIFSKKASKLFNNKQLQIEKLNKLLQDFFE